jgi:hypothetical protein
MSTIRLKDKHCEKGSIITIFTISLTVIIPILALSIDGYFMIQSRLDQQNITEYMSLAALSGFNEDALDDTDFGERRSNAINAIQEIAQSNSIIGLSNSSWDFAGNANCSGSSCTGLGWEVIFGYSDGTNFVPGESIDPGDSDLIDTSSINSILLKLKLKSDQNLAGFLLGNNQSTGIGNGEKQQILSDSVAMSETSGSRTIYKIIKMYAGGSAMGGSGGGDDGGDDGPGHT